MALTSMLKTAAAAIILAGALGGPSMAGALEDIKARGELIAGVKADYPPYANREKSGEITGLEIDLAQDLADRLGVKLKLFAVGADGRIQFLQQGSVDVLIATMAVTDLRAQQTGLIEPYYYASRLSVLAPKSAGIAGLADLKGKSVCMILKSYYSDELRERAEGVKLVTMRTLDDAGKALRDGRCLAFIHENSRLYELKRRTGAALADFHVTPLDFAPLPWAIAVHTGEKDAPFGKLVAATIADWHKSGKLAELEKKWVGENTSWVIDQQKAVK
jgi:polar amino acid transport system substrate-binding protein